LKSSNPAFISHMHLLNPCQPTSLTKG